MDHKYAESEIEHCEEQHKNHLLYAEPLQYSDNTTLPPWNFYHIEQQHFARSRSSSATTGDDTKFTSPKPHTCNAEHQSLTVKKIPT